MPLQSHPEDTEGPGEPQVEWRRQEETGDTAVHGATGDKSWDTST